MYLAANLLFFKAVWLTSLVGAGSGRPWLGAVLMAAFLAWHFSTTETRQADAGLMALAATAGFAIDTSFIHTRIFAYSEPVPFDGIAPFWILVMWMNFALTLNLSLRWLHGRRLAAMLLGAVGGPLAYLAGIKLGAAELTADPLLAAVSVGVAWAVAVPLLVTGAEMLNRLTPVAVPAAAESRGAEKNLRA